MSETRSYTVREKRFQRSDLLSLADIFQSLAREIGAGENDLTITVWTSDEVIYESSTARHLGEGSTADTKRVLAVEFNLRVYRESRHLSANLKLAHGDTHFGSNQLRVSGDEAFAHSAFSRLRERLSSVEPSSSWFQDTRDCYSTCLLSFWEF
jgi:hypothetical protein